MSIPARAAAAALAAAVLLVGCGGDGDDGAAHPTEPAGELVAEGQELYGGTCAACHGEDLKGTDSGPPFLSPIYAPNHHSDEAFYAAVENGVQPHHWEFGPMPPQPHVSREDVEAIVAYVRAEQEEAGITEDPSHP